MLMCFNCSSFSFAVVFYIPLWEWITVNLPFSWWWQLSNVLISWCWYKHSCQCFLMSMYKNLSREYTYSRITIQITILGQMVKFARWCQIVLKVVSPINTSTGSVWVPWPHNIFKLEKFCSSDGHTRFISLWF